MMDMKPSGIRETQIIQVESGRSSTKTDLLVVEEPLEIRLDWSSEGRRRAQSLSITMRTPGNDILLAIGFLRTEGVISTIHDVQKAAYCGPHAPKPSNVVKVTLKDHVTVDIKRLSRNFYTTSSCGVCGKTSLDAVKAQGLPPLLPGPKFTENAIHKMPKLLREAQPHFEKTGGLHGAALLGPDLKLLSIHEDVGRHNAVDKVIGHGLQSELNLSQAWLILSGRAGFELVQKALVVGIPAIVSVGAPSSLAVDLAKEQGMTLLGFARQHRFNIYSGQDRVVLSSPLRPEAR